MVAAGVNPLGFGLSAQSDTPGSSDHPLLARYDGSWIEYHTVLDYDEYTFATGLASAEYPKFPAEHLTTLEGKITRIGYDTPDGTTMLQVFRNYEAALERDGYEAVFHCLRAACKEGAFDNVAMALSAAGIEDYPSTIHNSMVIEMGYLVGRKTTGEGQVHIVVATGDGDPGDAAHYALHVVESAALELDKVSASQIADDLRGTGKATLYGIYFDTDMAVVKPESDPAIEAVAEFLASDASARLFVVGHTDGSGAYDHNLDLSSRRAQAVVAVLVERFGVAGARLTPAGAGPLAPVAANTSEDGRALNRRVELVLR